MSSRLRGTVIGRLNVYHEWSSGDESLFVCKPLHTPTLSELKRMGCCFYCGRFAPMTMDHRVPKSRGGTDKLDNIVWACAFCNSSKGASTEDEYRARRDHENVMLRRVALATGR